MGIALGQVRGLDVVTARQLVDRFALCYNQDRLYSAIGYVTPRDKLVGRESIIFAKRKRKPSQERPTREGVWHTAK